MYTEIWDERDHEFYIDDHTNVKPLRALMVTCNAIYGVLEDDFETLQVNF